MQFDLAPEDEALRDLAAQFAAEFLAPHAREWDERDEFDHRILTRAGELGLLNLELPEEWGGVEASTVSSVLTSIEIAKASAAACNMIGAVRLHLNLLNRFGTDEQKRKWIPLLSSGEKIAAFAMTEPGAGSDVAGIATRAVRDGDHYVINGGKIFITLGPVADLVILLCYTDPDKKQKGLSVVLVERGTPGLEVGPKEPMMGQHGIPVGALYFSDCRVPVTNVLGKEGEGMKIMLSGLDGTRTEIAALALGLSQAAYEHAAAHAARRQAFGQPIGEFQGVGFMLAEMWTEIEAGRLLTLRAAMKRDSGQRSSLEASMAKYYCTDNAMKHTTNAVQIFGGAGYSREYPLERFMRDAKITQIYDGTSQIHKLILSRAILDKFKDKAE